MHNISDNIIVHGVKHDQHDERLGKVLRRVRECGFTLNLEKCQFYMREMTFMGHACPIKSRSVCGRWQREGSSRSKTTGISFRSQVSLGSSTL